MWRSSRVVSLDSSFGQGRRCIYRVSDGRPGMLSTLFAYAFYLAGRVVFGFECTRLIRLFNYHGGIMYFHIFRGGRLSSVKATAFLLASVSCAAATAPGQR